MKSENFSPNLSVSTKIHGKNMEGKGHRNFLPIVTLKVEQVPPSLSGSQT